MPLTVALGATNVFFEIDGHSAVNGAPIPEGSTVTITSNDPSVATIGDVTVPAGGSASLRAPVTILTSGSTDGVVHIVAPDGTAFDASDTLIVTPAVEGLTHITAAFVQG